MSLKDYWYIASRSRELRSRPVARTVFGERLALFRGPGGEPAAVMDRCAHRNAPLSAGRTMGGCVQCPYHGWRYDGRGHLVEIPSLGRHRDLPAIPPIGSRPTCEQDGYVWVWMGDGPAVGAPRRFARMGEPGWTTFTMYNRFQASVESCMENFLDVPHSVFVHSGWFRTRDPREVLAKVTRAHDSVTAEFFDEPDARSIVSRLLFPRGVTLRHTDTFMLPSTSRVDYDFSPDRHFIITSQATPVGELRTDVHTVITFRFGNVGSLVRLFFEPLSWLIILQDVRILRMQCDQLNHYGGTRFSYVETDLLVRHIHSLRGNCERDQVTEPDEREVVIRF